MTHTDENMDTGTVVSQTSNDENAIDVLSGLASRNGFTIHNVPADGDCLFSTNYPLLEYLTLMPIALGLW